MNISMIAAISENRVIGNKGKIPWHISEDFKHFKTITTGHPIIMGRKTFESIGKPLPNRTNIIVTRDPNYVADGCIITSSLEEALTKAQEIDPQEIFICGGGEIYRQALPFANKLYLTIVHTQIEGDAFFPDYSEFKKIIFKEDKESQGYKYTFLELVKE